MQTRHIFFVFADFGLGGIQQKMVDIVDYINHSKKYHSIQCHLIFRRPSSFSFIQHIHSKSVRVHTASSFLYQKNGLFFMLYVAWLIIRFNPFAIVAFLHQFSVPIAILKLFFFGERFKLIISQDTILSFDNSQIHSKRTYPKFLLSFVYQFADCILTQTHIAKYDLVKYYAISSNKIHVVPNWTVKTTYLNKQKKYDLIFCGRFAKQKRLDRLLDMMVLLKDQRSSMHLYLVGDGEEKERMRHDVAYLGLSDNVHFLPPSHDVSGLLSQASIFVLSSDFEGHPLVLLEAMVQKTVPVVFNYPGVHEYIIDGKTGFIEPTISDMAQRILLLLHDKKMRERVGEQARHDVLKRFSHRRLHETMQLVTEGCHI